MTLCAGPPIETLGTPIETSGTNVLLNVQVLNKSSWHRATHPHPACHMVRSQYPLIPYLGGDPQRVLKAHTTHNHGATSGILYDCTLWYGQAEMPVTLSCCQGEVSPGSLRHRAPPDVAPDTACTHTTSTSLTKYKILLSSTQPLPSPLGHHCVTVSW
jgi:hypothetical protein